MGWEEVEEPCCELRGTLTPVEPQVMGFYQLFNKPGFLLPWKLHVDEGCCVFWLVLITASRALSLELASDCHPAHQRRCLMSECFIDTPSVEPRGLSSPHCRACQDLSAAPPTLLPVSAAPRLLPLMDVARRNQESSELGVELRHELNLPQFFLVSSELPIAKVEVSSLLEMPSPAPCCELVNTFPGKQYWRQNGGGSQ